MTTFSEIIKRHISHQRTVLNWLLVGLLLTFVFVAPSVQAANYSKITREVWVAARKTIPRTRFWKLASNPRFWREIAKKSKILAKQSGRKIATNPVQTAFFVVGCVSLGFSAFRMLRIKNKSHTKTANCDDIEVGIVAPSRVAREEDIMIQVVVDVCKTFLDSVNEAKDLDRTNDATLRGKLSVPQVRRGSILSFSLDMPGFSVDEPIQRHKWEGTSFALQFFASALQSCSCGSHRTILSVWVNSRPVGRIGFLVNLVDAKSAASLKENAKTIPISYLHYFISYSDKDFSKVVNRLQGLRLADPDIEKHSFLDKMFLKPGERYKPKIFEYIDRKADVFLLFWSHNSACSKWVEREWKRALVRQKETGNKPDILPVPLEIPIPQPPQELSHIHFNDNFLLLSEGLKPKNLKEECQHQK